MSPLSVIPATRETMSSVCRPRCCTPGPPCCRLNVSTCESSVQRNRGARSVPSGHCQLVSGQRLRPLATCSYRISTLSEQGRFPRSLFCPRSLSRPCTRSLFCPRSLSLSLSPLFILVPGIRLKRVGILWATIIAARLSAQKSVSLRPVWPPPRHLLTV